MRLSRTPVTLYRLGEIASIQPGLSTGTGLEHRDDGTHQVVLSKHLTPGAPYVYTSEDFFRIHPTSTEPRSRFPSQHTRGLILSDEGESFGRRDVSRYELSPGDVLFMSRGTRNVATRIADVPMLSVAPVSFFVLRPGDQRLQSDLLKPHVEIDPRYIVWYLNSPTAQKAIGDIRTGAGTPIVQRAAFQELGIPIPELSLQGQLGALGELMATERALREKLAEASRRAQDQTNDAIVRALLDRAGRTTHTKR